MHQQHFTDQLGCSISVGFPPQRIISLVPSQTELLFYFGLDAQVIGITKFCNHPAAKVKHVTKVGGTKKLDLDLIRSLNPDLIIGNKEENNQSQIETLMQEFPVWMSDIYDLSGSLQMIAGIGAITDRPMKAQLLVSQIQTGFNTLPKLTTPVKVAYLIWQKPYMLAAKNTFIDDMLQRCGYVNASEAERYPQVSAEELQAANPDVVMLSSEPFPFKDKHVRQLQQICTQSKVVLVDGEMFSWYGSRLLLAAQYFKQLNDNILNNHP